MITTVNRWGTSFGIRLSKNLLESFEISDKTKLEVTTDGDKIILRKVKENPLTIADYFKNYPKDEFYKQDEFDWGKPVGDEV